MKDAPLDHLLLRASFWAGFSEVASGVATLITGIIAARVLSPHDFGLMGVAMLLLGALESLSHTGFQSALLAKKDEVESHLDVAWTSLVLRGALITLLLGISAPFIARFYNAPQMLPLLLVCSLTPFIAGFSNIGQILYTRELEFRTLFLIQTSSTLLRILVFIPAIFYFRNVWALVVSYVGGGITSVIVSYVSHPYRPKFRMEWSKFRYLIGYGKWITGLAVIGYVITKGDDLFVSKYFGLVALGLYQMAYDVANFPTTSITHVLGRIAMPAYAKFQKEPEHFRSAFVKIMRGTLLITGPISLLIFIGAPDYVDYVIGRKWAPAIPYMRILAAAGFLRSFAALAGPVFQAANHPEYDFRMNLPRFLMVVVLLWPFCALWGVPGACLVVLIAISMCLPTWFWGIHRLVQLRVRDVLRENRLAMLSSAVYAMSYYGLRRMLHGAVGALVALIGGIALWAALMAVIGRFTPFDLFGEIRRLRKTIRTKQVEVAPEPPAALDAAGTSDG